MTANVADSLSSKTMSRPASTPWLACLNPHAQAALRLFCFPYAGGGTSIFGKWPKGLPANIEVCAVELPGRGARLTEPPLTQLPSLVRSAADAIRPHLDKPFAFFGHSMGTLVSFELARLLRREDGRGPVHLFVSGGSAPQVPHTCRITRDLSDPELVEELRGLNGMSAELLENHELMQIMLPVIRADFELIENYLYRAEPPLDCPITAFGGLHDQVVNRGQLEAWRDQTTAAFALRMLPGDHFFLHTAQALLLRLISRELYQIVGT